jgi:endonuclease YncB( thermonuclease family)
MRELPGGVVEEVIDGDTARLADGREIRFVGIQAPKLPLGRKGFMPWPLAEEARAAAAELMLGKEVALSVDGRSVDRHGRVLAHLFVGDEKIWVQRALVEQGWARVYSFADNYGCTLELLEVAGEARRARRGIWAHPFYAVRSADDLKKLEGLTGSFQLIEGEVIDVSYVKSKLYMNFAHDWRRDFTVTITKRDLRRFGPGKPVPDMLAALKGGVIRVRGWLRDRNGPEIVLTHPEQIEVLMLPGAPPALPQPEEGEPGE